MTPRQRVETALAGGKADTVPVMPIYDRGYMLRLVGRDEREHLTTSPEKWGQLQEQVLLRHPTDGLFVHVCAEREWVERQRVERFEDHWRFTDTMTGVRFKALPDGVAIYDDPEAQPPQVFVREEADLDRLPPPPDPEKIACSGRYEPLRYMMERFPDHHISFQTGSPAIYAINACGGYVEGLETMAGNPDLFVQLLERAAREQIAQIHAAKLVGCYSTWFTCYYTGADTISPGMYADLLFEYDHRVCQAAKDAGMVVLNWYLGDLNPVLDTLMKLPMDALVLEQGRKGYVIDPVALRERVGPGFCLFGFAEENDYCEYRKENLTYHLERQIKGAGAEGAFAAGTPIMPPNANPEAVDFYFAEARRLGRYA